MSSLSGVDAEGGTRVKEPSDQLTAEPAADVAADPVVEQRPKRVVLRRVVTVLAGLLLFCALTLPREIDQVTPSAFLRIPVEGLAAVALLLLLPARPRRVVAAVGGALLGLLTIIKFIDMGFLATVARPFDPVLDWSLVGDAYNFVHESFGERGGASARRCSRSCSSSS